ncbi:hypothetical protein GN956_G4674 [Arapaima gigas]
MPLVNNQLYDTVFVSHIAAVEVTESTMGDYPGSSEDLTVKKKSKFKILKTRLFGRIKWKGTGESIKQSQSASDITIPGDVKVGYDSEEEFMYSQGTLGSRALSHDSIFFSSQPQTSSDPEQAASQENVHGRVKALQQTKLLQQNIRLGPPPVIVPTQRTDDTGASSEDDGLPHSPPDILLHEGLKYPDPHRHPSSLSLVGTGSEEEEQGPAPSLSHLISPIIRSPLQPTNPAALLPAPISSPTVDFDTPAQFVPCLDNSAARHRMSIKPRNQRASAKARRGTSSVHRPHSESFNDLECSVPEKEEEEEESDEEIFRCQSYSTQVLQSVDGSTSPEVRNASTVMVQSAEQETKRDSVVLEGPFNIAGPLEPMGNVITNPLFLHPIPVSLEPFQAGESKPETVTVSPVSPSTELQKPQAVVQEVVASKPPSPNQIQGAKDLIKEILQNSSQKHLPTPSKSCVLEHTSLRDTALKQNQVSIGVSAPPNIKDNIGNGFWGRTRAVQSENPLNLQSIASPSTQTIFQSGDRTKISPLKKNIPGEAGMQECSTTGLVQHTLVPHSDPDNQQTPEPDKFRQQRPNSGSFKFSVSSAWDRPRASSFTGWVEQPGPKTDKSSFSHKIQERYSVKQEEVKSKETPTNQVVALKSEESPVIKVPPNPKMHPQSAGYLEMAKPKDLLWTLEGKPTLRKDYTTFREVKAETGDGAGKPVQISGNSGGGKNIQENELKNKQETSQEDTELKNSFGVKLRSTSLSLKYRSDVAQSEMISKRRSVEVCPPASPHGPAQASLLSPPPVRPGVSKPTTNEDVESLFVETLSAKPPLPRKPQSQNSDSLASSAILTLTSFDSSCRDREKNELFKSGDRGVTPKPTVAPPKELEHVSSEPAWMTMAREKTRSLQQLFTSKLVPMASPQASPQPPPQERRPMSWLLPDKLVKTDITEGNTDLTPVMKSKSPLMPKKAEGESADTKTNPVPQTEPGKTSSTPIIPQKPLDDVRCEVKMDGRPAMNIRAPALARTTLASETDKEDRWQKKSEPISLLLSPSTAMTPTTSAEQPTSGHGQPSWLELAKRKSLAWSDKAMD